MNRPSSQTTPQFRLAVTSLGLSGLLGIALFTETLWALATLDGALVGLAVSIVVSVFAWRYPDEFVSTPRAEAGALAFVLISGVMFGLHAPALLAVMMWVLVWTCCGLAVVTVGRPTALAQVLQRVEDGQTPR
jgi:hypothetical protein